MARSYAAIAASIAAVLLIISVTVLYVAPQDDQPRATQLSSTADLAPSSSSHVSTTETSVDPSSDTSASPAERPVDAAVTVAEDLVTAAAEKAAEAQEEEEVAAEQQRQNTEPRTHSAVLPPTPHTPQSLDMNAKVKYALLPEDNIAKPMMPYQSSGEINYLATVLSRPDIKHYFEFGSGGSTAFAASIGVASIESVDSHEQWFANVSSYPPLRRMADDNRFFYHYVEIGSANGSFGLPQPGADPNLFPNYPRSIRNARYTPDLVFVDGRFRVACAAEAALRCPNAFILIHDYSVRPAYFAVESFLQEVDRVASLVLFKRKPYVPDTIIREIVQKYEKVVH
jgi:hypothetical protein